MIERLAPITDRAERPLVSIVMPTWRRPSVIGDSVRSLLCQTLTNFELIISDDGDGSDGTAEAVCAAAGGDGRVRYVRNPAPLRMPQNLNAAIILSRGSFIAVCHDHDLYREDFLASMLAVLTKHPRATFVHCGVAIIDQNGQSKGVHVGAWPPVSEGQAWARRMLATEHCPVCALTVVPRAQHEIHGLYDPAFGFIADVEMWLRLSCAGDVGYVAEPLIRVRERESDHAATRQATALMLTMRRIQRAYLTRVFDSPGRFIERGRLEWRYTRALARQFASSAVRRAVRP